MFWSGDRSCCNILVLVSAVKDPVPLRHLGKWEVLAWIDLMEDQFDVPMWFDLDCIPANSTPTAAEEEVRSWGYGMAMFSCCYGPQERVSDTLLDGWHARVCIRGGDEWHQGLPEVSQQLPAGTGQYHLTGRVIAFCSFSAVGDMVWWPYSVLFHDCV